MSAADFLSVEDLPNLGRIPARQTNENARQFARLITRTPVSSPVAGSNTLNRSTPSASFVMKDSADSVAPTEVTVSAVGSETSSAVTSGADAPVSDAIRQISVAATANMPKISTNVRAETRRLSDLSCGTSRQSSLSFFMNDPETDAPMGELILLTTGAPGRLDKALAIDAPAGLSRSRLTTLIRAGAVSRQGGETVRDPKAKVKVGEGFEVTLPPAEDPDPQPENIPLTIIFEDEHLIVVEKPVGMVVHPAPGAP